MNPTFQDNYKYNPETGLVMLRGRADGSGHPFNLGEATVTRCVASLVGATLRSQFSTTKIFVAKKSKLMLTVSILFEGCIDGNRQKGNDSERS